MPRERYIYGDDLLTETVNLWRPIADGRVLSGLAIPFHGGKMTWERYKNLLENRLAELINEDPTEAYELLTDSPEYNPDLCTIARNGNREHWPVQIMMSDQMMIRLNQIDFSRDLLDSVTSEEVPTLQELIEYL